MDEIVSKIAELAMGQGLWAVLYLYLFFRMLKKNKEREDKYQETIRDLGTNIHDGIKKIQEKLDNVLDGREKKQMEEK